MTTEKFNDKHRCRVCGWEQGNSGWVPLDQTVTHTVDHQAKLDASPKVIEMPVRHEAEAIGLNTITQGNCLDLLPRVASGSVDMVLCDLPYGTTQNKWDSVIPFDALWVQYKRVLKPGGAVALSAAQPFTTTVVASNLPWFKYEWIWEKEAGTGFLNAKKQPLRSRENILVFYAQQPVYNPQMEAGKPYTCKKGGLTDNYRPDSKDNIVTVNEGLRYPKTVLRFQRDAGKVHPTQKPVALWEYLIRTYTNEGDTVLDNCCGSGTTGVACQNTGRNFIQFELDPKYCEIARSRLKPIKDENEVQLPEAA